MEFFFITILFMLKKKWATMLDAPTITFFTITERFFAS